MIKLLDILKENSDNKQAVLNHLDFKRAKTFANSTEGKAIRKIIDRVNDLNGEELRQYLKDGFSNKSNSWAIRLTYSDLLKKLEGK
jgi:hypothetical protein